MLAAQKKQEAEKAKQAEEDRIAAEEAEAARKAAEERIAAEEAEERKRQEDEERKRLEAENKAAEKLKKVKDDVDGLFKRAEKLHKENVPTTMDKESGVECEDDIYSKFSKIEEELNTIKDNNNDITVKGDKVLNYVYSYQIHCSMDYLRDTDNKIPLKVIKDKIENIKDDKIKSELNGKINRKLDLWYQLNVNGFKENIDRAANDKVVLQTLSDQLDLPYEDKGDNKEGYKEKDKTKFKKLIKEKIDIFELNELKTQAEDVNKKINDNSELAEIQLAVETVNKLYDESQNYGDSDDLKEIKDKINDVKKNLENKLNKKMDALDLEKNEKRKIILLNKIQSARNYKELKKLEEESYNLELKELYDDKLNKISTASVNLIQEIQTLSNRFKNSDLSSSDFKDIKRKFNDINNDPLKEDKTVIQEFNKLSELVKKFQEDMTYEKQADDLINDLRISGSPNLKEKYKNEKDIIDDTIQRITNSSIKKKLTQKLNNAEKIIVDGLINDLITQNSSQLTDKYKNTKKIINSTIETINNTGIKGELIQKLNIAEKIIKLKLDDSGLTDFNDIKDYINGLSDIKGGDRVYYNNKLLLKMYQLVEDLPDPGRSERREELGLELSSNEPDKYIIMKSMIDSTPWKTEAKLANLRGLDALGEGTGNLSDKIEEKFNTKITQKEITEAYSEAREAWDRYKEEGLPITTNGFIAKKKKLEKMYSSSEYGQQSPQAQENKKIKATKEIKDLIEKIQILYGILDNYINLGSRDTEEKEKDRYNDMMTRKINFSSTEIGTGKKLGFLEILKVIYNKHTYKWIEKAANKYIDGDKVFEEKKGTSPEDNKSKFISYMELFNTTMGKEAQQAAQTEEEREELKKKFDAMNELKTNLEKEGKGLPPKSGGGSRRKQTKKKKRR